MRLTPRQLRTATPHPPVTMVRCPGPYNPPNPLKPRQIVRCLRMLTHARSYLNPLNPLSGIPEGLIDSIDRGSLRGDPLGLDSEKFTGNVTICWGG